MPNRNARLLAAAQAASYSGDVRAAIDAYTRLIARVPSSAIAWYGRGLVHCKLEHHADAIADLDRAIALRPRFAAALTERGLAYVGSGRIERGIADYDAAIAADPAYALAHINKGAAHLQRERWADALPCLDLGIRLWPPEVQARYNRGVAYEMTGDLRRALRDYDDAAQGSGAHAKHARARAAALRAEVSDLAAAEWDVTELMFPLLEVAVERTVGELVHKIHVEQAFFGTLLLDDGDPAVVPFYGRRGYRRRLTEVADAIGPRILALTLRQIPGLVPSEVIAPRAAAPAGGGEWVAEGMQTTVLANGNQLLGAVVNAMEPDDLDVPTALFGAAPSFDRCDTGESARTCRACKRAVAYFETTLDAAGQLVDYACPHCAASPIPGWVEQRMRPGCWSADGFLGEAESLDEVIARDAATLARLDTTHAQVADALEALLAHAVRGAQASIARATIQSLDELQASGQRGVPGLSMLPLGLTLDEIEAQLDGGGRIPAERSSSIGDHEVYLQMYLGYQHCPYTILHGPWSDALPPRELVRTVVDRMTRVTVATDCVIPCRDRQSYSYANIEFMIVRKSSGLALRGSGLLVHLIRDHQFFEGLDSPFRLDPDLAVQILQR